MKKLNLICAVLACLVAAPLAGCAGGAGEKVFETHDVAVTHVERAVTEAQVLNNNPPAPLPARPADAEAAADSLAAKLCEYVGFAGKADALAQHAAGLTPVQRVFEPICAPQGHAAAP